MNIFDSWIVKTPIAHRGLHNEEIPENSLASFENAIKHNYAIEIDLRITSDGRIVVFHDDNLGRMTGSSGYVNKTKLEDIKKLRLGKSAESIPTLEETLELVAGRTPLLIELKNMNKIGEMEKAVWAILSKYPGEYCIQSFNPYTLEWFKNHAPQVKRGQLSCFFKGADIDAIKKYALKRLWLNKVSEPNFISYNIDDLPNKYVKKYRDLPLLAWCVRTIEQKEKALKYADNIIFENVDPE